MGRTKRKRRSKRRNFKTCDHDNELILLNIWLKKQHCEYNKKLVLATFAETGRGVLTKQKIYPGEELMSLPLNTTINVTTILMDEAFKGIFPEYDCFNTYTKSISFQSFLAFYLVYLMFLGEESKWYIYLKTLPTEYTVPYFLPNEIKSYLSKNILSIVRKQEVIVESSYNIFIKMLQLGRSVEFKNYFTKSEYEWAYFTVNTRCVYMDFSKILDFSSLKKSVLDLLNDDSNIALCPFLDMINHSSNARNETKLFLNSDIKEFQITNLSEDMFSGVQFNLYTKNHFKEFGEVFICYGDSHNLKLVTEYGFFLPNNNLDCVSFKFDVVIDYLASQHIKLSQEQLSFVNNHRLNTDLYIDIKGLSFNFCALLMVVKLYYEQNTNVNRIIYSSDLSSSDRNALNHIIVPFIKENIINLKNANSNLEKCEYKSPILSNCLALMCQYVNILEKFIKC